MIQSKNYVFDKVYNNLINIKFNYVEYKKIIRKLKNHINYYYRCNKPDNLLFSLGLDNNGNVIFFLKYKNRNDLYIDVYEHKNKKYNIRTILTIDINELISNNSLFNTEWLITDNEKSELELYEKITLEINSYIKERIEHILVDIKKDYLEQDNRINIFMLTKYNFILNILNDIELIDIINNVSINENIFDSDHYLDNKSMKTVQEMINKMENNYIFLNFPKPFFRLTHNPFKSDIIVNSDFIQKISKGEKYTERFIQAKKSYILAMDMEIPFKTYNLNFYILVVYGLYQNLFNKKELTKLEEYGIFKEIMNSLNFNINLTKLLHNNNFKLTKEMEHTFKFNTYSVDNVIYPEKLLKPKMILSNTYEDLDSNHLYKLSYFIKILNVLIKYHSLYIQTSLSEKEFSQLKNDIKDYILPNLEFFPEFSDLEEGELTYLIEEKLHLIEDNVAKKLYPSHIKI